MAQEFHATAVYSDQTTLDVTEQAAWTSSPAGVLDLSDAAGSKGQALALAPGSATVTATLEGASGSATATVVALTLVRVDVTPESPQVPKGQDVQLTATAFYDDSTSRDVTAVATWSSAAPGTASVSDEPGSKGLTHGVAVGTAIVEASFGGQTGSVTVSVTAAPLASVRVEPLDSTIPVGGEIALAAYGVFGDGSEVPVTGAAGWSAEPSGVVTLAAPGAVTGIAPGTANVYATFEGHTGSATVTVRSATLVSIHVTPVSPATVVGGTVRLTVTGTYDNDRVVDVASLVTWSTDAPLVVAVSNEAATRGTLTGLSVGTASVTATLDGLSDSVGARVTELVPAAVRVDPDVMTVSPSRTVTLRAFGMDESGAEVEVTGAATWTTSARAVATVSGGVVTGAALGTAVVTAAYGGASGYADVKVEAPYPVALRIRAEDPVSAGVGAEGALRAKALYSDGTQRDVTEEAVWTSDAPAIVTVSDSPGSKGEASCLSAGTAHVSVSFAGFSALVTLVVTPRAVSWIILSVTPWPLPVGVTHQLRAQAVYDDWNVQDVTSTVSWSASGAVSIDPAGLATTLSAGSGVVVATLGGVSASTLVSVIGDSPVGLTLTLRRTTISQGETTWWDAYLEYPNNVRYEVDDSATLSSLTPWIADVIQLGALGPMPHGVSPGTATLEARCAGRAGRATLTVSAPSARTLTLPGEIPVGTSVRATLRSAAYYDLGDQATWTSSDQSVVTVTNGSGLNARGWVTAVGVGSAFVSATYGGNTSTTLIGVRPRALTIDVRPSFATVVQHAGPLDGQKFTAYANLADGSSLDVTALAEWTTADRDVAAPGWGTPGWIDAYALGTTTVIAAFGSIAGHAMLSVLPEAVVDLGLLPPGTVRLPLGVSVRLGALAKGTTSWDYYSVPPSSVGWSISDANVASFSNEAGHEGELTTIAKGNATITGAFGGLIRTVALVVDDVVGLVPPAPLALKTAQRQTVQVVAMFSCTPVPPATTCTYPTADVAPFLGAWSSTEPSVATANGSEVLALTPGASTVGATFGGQMVVLPVDVATPTVASVAVAPPTGSYFVGTRTPVHARATLDNGDSLDVTDLASWDVTPSTVAAVTGAPPALDALAYGLATLSATYAGMTDSVSVGVTNWEAAAPVFAPDVIALPVGASTTTYVLPHGSTTHAGSEAVVTSSDPSVATASAGPSGVSVTAMRAGTALLTAAYRGHEAYAAVSVHEDAGPLRVEAPGSYSPFIHVPERVQLSATAAGSTAYAGNYRNEVDVTRGARWSSSDPSVARIASQGVVEGVAPGRVEVTAALGGASASEWVTVLPDTLESLSISSFAVALPVGAACSLRASGSYSDGASVSLQHRVTWWTENAETADFDPVTPGLLRARAAGVTYVEARYAGKSARIPVTVF